MAAIESWSSCDPQANSQPEPPIAQAPKPIGVMCKSVSPSHRVSIVPPRACLPGLAGPPTVPEAAVFPFVLLGLTGNIPVSGYRDKKTTYPGIKTATFGTGRDERRASDSRSWPSSSGRVASGWGPSDAGLEPGRRRRTPGLRREEVAQLAGVSVTWYTWLEQGRSVRASEEVLDRLGRVLRLDPAEHRHLFVLARGHPPADPLDPPAVVDAAAPGGAGRPALPRLRGDERLDGRRLEPRRPAGLRRLRGASPAASGTSSGWPSPTPAIGGWR